MASKETAHPAAHTPRTMSATSQARDKAIDLALAAIDKQFGKGAIMRLGEDPIDREVEVIPTRLARPRHRARHRRPAARPHRRDLRAGVERQDDADAPRRRRGAEARRRVRVHRRRARARRRLRQEARREDRGAARLQPDFGEQALEIADMLVRSSAVDVIVVDSVAALTPKAELEGEMGDHARRPAGPPDEPGAAQADRRDLEVAHDGHLHQPDPHEDRRHVRLAGDDDRRQRAQVLRVGPPRHPPHRRAQEGRGRRSATARA